jgi:hypothetical protein
MASIDADPEKKNAVYAWFRKAIKNDDLIKRISDEKANELMWADRYEKEQPALIAHHRYGPCLIHAHRKVPRFLGAQSTFYLVTLVTAVEDAQLRASRAGFFEVPAIVAVDDRRGDEQILEFVYPVKALITRFVLVEPKESSILDVYDGEKYTRMMLSELRQRIEVERDVALRIAFDAFKQSNPAFVAESGISAATVSTEQADARLITSKLESPLEDRHALAPTFLHGMIRENETRKGNSSIEACYGTRVHDSHGVIRHLRK